MSSQGCSLKNLLCCRKKKSDRNSRASNTPALHEELTNSQEARKKGNKGKSKNNIRTTAASEHQARLLSQDDRDAQDALYVRNKELERTQFNYIQVLDENKRLKQEQHDERQDHQRALEDQENELKKYRSHYQHLLDENNRLKQEQCDESGRLRQDRQRALVALNDKEKELKKYQSDYQQVLDENYRLTQELCDQSTGKVSRRISNIEDDESENQIGSAHHDVVLEKESLLQQHTSHQPDHLQTKAKKGKKKASKKKTEAENENEAEMNVMRKQITAFQNEVADLQVEISTLTRDKETANMKYEEGKAIYTENIHNLRSTQAELTSTKEELTSSKAKLTSMLDKLTSTQAKLTSTTTKLSSTLDELSSTQDELNSTRAELKSTQVEPSSSLDKLASTQDELTSTQAELASTLFANEKLELQLVQLQSEQDKLKLEKKDLRKNIKERDRFLADVQNQFDDMKRSNEDSQTQLRQQYAAVEELQNELFQKNRQIEQLQQDSTNNPTNEAGYQDKDDVIRQLNEEMSALRDSMRRQLQVKDDENMALRLALENEERQTARRQDDCASVESLGSDLAKSKNRIKHLQADVSRLTNQLSKQMHQKLNEDESALENINSKNRPSKIVEDYQEMMTSEWLDAKDALDTVYPDETLEQRKIAFLTSVLMDAHNLAEEQLTLHKRHLHNILLNPINGAAEAGRGYTAEEEQGAASRAESAPISRDLVAALTAFIKDHSDTANVHQLSQMVMSRLKDKPQWNSIICNLEDDRALMEYVKSACALVWRMVVQKPPLTLSTPDIGQPHTKDKHEVYFDCPKHPANVIVSYVAPIMVQNSKNLTKGKVFVAPRE